MVAIHRITEDLLEDHFELVAIHSSLEDYALVYHLNAVLKSNFKRAPKDLQTAKRFFFPWFEWRDEPNDTYWTLIKNEGSMEDQHDKKEGLFSNETSFVVYHFLPEQREVDYFIKIAHDGMALEKDVVSILNGVPHVMAAYTLDTNKLKSKKNLIF